MSTLAELMSRRKLVGAATAAGVTIAAGHALASAQATPDATPASQEAQLTIDQTAAQPTRLGAAVPPEFTSNETNWPTEHGNLSGTRSAAGSSISLKTIDTLGVAWRIPVEAPGTYGSLTSTPIVVDDTIYLIDMQSNIWSIDKATGKTNWKTEYNVGLLGPNGLAVAYGQVFGALGDTSEVVSVDGKTGKENWRVQLSNNKYEGIDIAPFVYDSIVYVSTIPGNSTSFYQGGSKGILYGLDASTGLTLFQWDTTGDGLWGNFRVNSGGGLWHPPVVDDNGYLYFSVANPAPWPGNKEFPNGTSRPGDNAYSNSLVSMDPDGGFIRWHIGVKPHDLFDLDLHLSPILAKVTIDKKERNVVFASGKLGIVIAADTMTGEELWRVPVGTHKNDNLQELGTDYVEIYPGNNGGVETPMAYADGIIYCAVLEMPSSYNASGYADPLFDLNTATGLLVALDATSGNVVWQAKLPTAAYGSAVVANDVVFTGGLDGVVLGFNAKTGEQVFSFQTGSGLNAPASISGDYLFIPATGPLIPSSATKDPKPAQELIALKIGSGAATPTS
ncbi:MAG TPA: PQQ-binding-like beta-propeller repeat protein [Thermomicrobiales bacterium]|nr:PQQ-binding-like beta-propeller repeat protein [Thermomicrobiales bacterium]